MSLFADLFNRGAVTLTPEKHRLDVVGALAAAGAVLATIIPFYGPAERIFANLPGVPRAIHFLVPLGVLAIALHVITLKQKVGRQIGFPTGPADERLMYAEPGGRRLVAKVALLPVIFILLWEIYDKAPNVLFGLFGRNVIRAFVHDPSGVPLRNVTLALYDSFGNRVSPEATSDDTGFVFLRPEPWGQRPVTWAAIGRCTAEHFPVRGTELPASTSQIDPPRNPAVSWTLPCPAK